MSFPMILTKNYLNIVIDGKPHTVPADNLMFDDIIKAIKAQNWDAVREFADLALRINKAGQGKITVEGGVIMYEGEEVKNVVTERIFQMMAEGFGVDPMLKFLENLMKNPWKSAIDEMYLFMEHNKLPLTEDGHFLAYKVVTANFLDCHTKTVDNSVGAKPFMNRSQCDPNRHNHCSSGFHFCGLDYVSFFTGDKVIIVKINPADVTSIPSDYHNAKGRCNTYEVIEFYGDYADVVGVHRWDKSVASDDEEFDSEEEFSDEDPEPESSDDAITEEIHILGRNPINAAREEADLGQRELAEWAGYSRSTLWNAEQIGNTPKTETIDRWINDMNMLLAERDSRMSLSYNKDYTVLTVKTW